jgi:peptidoglycan/xylan/chitin deacetylase (PgdA/CDA1 family)
MIGTVTRVETAHPVIALTFDDGPDPAVTNDLLDVLDAFGAKATFFMVGRAAHAHRDVVERAARAGHEIGNHTWSHEALPALSLRAQRREIERGARALAPFGSRLLRPPYGQQSRLSHLVARAHGHTVVAWSLAVHDWSLDTPDAIADRVAARVRPGDIVLLHDGLVDRDGRRANGRAVVVSAVAELLARLDGTLGCVGVSRLMSLGRIVRRRWLWRPREEGE